MISLEVGEILCVDIPENPSIPCDTLEITELEASDAILAVTHDVALTPQEWDDEFEWEDDWHSSGNDLRHVAACRSGRSRGS